MKYEMRRKDREVTDPAEIRDILDRAKVVHVAMLDGDTPYVLPMNYGYVLENGQLKLYLHSALQGRKLEVLRRNGHVGFCMECDLMPVAGETACKYGMAFSSVVGSGTAAPVTDMEEKKAGLAALMRTQTGREFSFDDRMTEHVAVICITATEFSAKKHPLPQAL